MLALSSLLIEINFFLIKEDVKNILKGIELKANKRLVFCRL